MIPGFEEYTHELTKHEVKTVLPLLIKGLEKKVGKKNAITAKQMSEGLLKNSNIKVSLPRIRKMIQNIRITGTIMNLIAGKGYWIATDKKEMQDYLDALQSRIDSQQFMHNALKWQLTKTSFDDELSDALSWDDLANYYDKHNSGRKARTLPMEQIYKWCEKRTDVFFVKEKEGTIHFKK